MKSIFLATTILFSASLLHADVMEDRSKTMKGFGEAMKVLTPMSKGEVDFDADAVASALANIQAGSKTLTDLFPEGSTNEESEASPKIWEDPDGFSEMIANFVASADEVAANMPTDAETLGASLAVIGKNCKSCHEGYRIKKD